MTLEPGERTEVLGPLYYTEHSGTTRTWAVPPLISDTADEATDSREFHIAYPILTYNRYGPEYRFQLLQLFAFSGGKTMAEPGANVRRVTIFPLYFSRRSEQSPELNYTAVFPFYGTIRNHLFRDEIEWVMWPVYVKTRRGGGRSTEVGADEFLSLPYRFVRARKQEVTTYNFLAPIFHVRYGDHLQGWQFWPLVGHEHKALTYRTNTWADVEPVGGHDRFFALWPIYFNQHNGIGTTNASRQQVLLPFYSLYRAPERDATTYGWPFGYNVVDDRARQYREWDVLWPLMVFARGEGKSGNRVLPFFSVMRGKEQERRMYAWPIYRSVHLKAPPLDRRYDRIVYFLYTDLKERDTETDRRSRRITAWPFFIWKRDQAGRSRFQLLAPLEPILPASESVERDYSPLWSIWRTEKNPPMSAASHSLLWNLYRYERTAVTKKASLLFGLFQYESAPDGTQWRLLHLPVARTQRAPAGKPTTP